MERASRQIADVELPSTRWPHQFWPPTRPWLWRPSSFAGRQVLWEDRISNMVFVDVGRLGSWLAHCIRTKWPTVLTPCVVEKFDTCWYLVWSIKHSRNHKPRVGIVGRALSLSDTGYETLDKQAVTLLLCIGHATIIHTRRMWIVPDFVEHSDGSHISD